MTATTPDTRLRELERETRADPLAGLVRYVLEHGRAGRLPRVGGEPHGAPCVQVAQVAGLKKLRQHPWRLPLIRGTRVAMEAWWVPSFEENPRAGRKPFVLAMLVSPRKGAPYASRMLSRERDRCLDFSTAGELAAWLDPMTVRVRFYDDPCSEVVTGAFPGERTPCSQPWWHRGGHVR